MYNVYTKYVTKICVQNNLKNLYARTDAHLLQSERIKGNHHSTIKLQVIPILFKDILVYEKTFYVKHLSC